MKRLPQFIACFSLIFGPLAAHAVPTLNIDSNGQLTGAQDVGITGTLYDVTFIRDTCANVFGGCDEIASFDFQSEADAVAAGQALLQQVFLDFSSSLLFDTDPSLTFGCNSTERCDIDIPYGFASPFLLVATTANRVDNIDLDFTISIDRNLNDQAVYARFSVSDASLPEPGTLGLLVFGLVDAGLVRQRKVGSIRADLVC